jgi:hypothetical protein
VGDESLAEGLRYGTALYLRYTVVRVKRLRTNLEP